jgi:hypothetical protein
MHPHWHLREAHELAREHGVDPTLGLDEAEAALRALKHGTNEITGAARRTPVALLLDQFKDFMILVLLGAAVVSGVIGELVDTLAILVIVLLNAVIGFVQAWRADRALAALQQLAAAQCHRAARRAATGGAGGPAGARRHRAAGGGQPGAGRPAPDRDRPAEDRRIGADRRVGHRRQAHGVLAEAASALGDRLNMAFKGTTAAHGRGTGLVVATGMATELGKVAGCWTAPSTEHAAAEAPGRLRQAAGPRGAGDLRADLRDRRAARRVAGADDPHGRQPGGGSDSRGAAGGGHGAAGARRTPHGRCRTRWSAGCRRSRRWARSAPSAPTRPAR